MACLSVYLFVSKLSPAPAILVVPKILTVSDIESLDGLRIESSVAVPIYNNTDADIRISNVVTSCHCVRGIYPELVKAHSAGEMSLIIKAPATQFTPARVDAVISTIENEKSVRHKLSVVYNARPEPALTQAKIMIASKGDLHGPIRVAIAVPPQCYNESPIKELVCTAKSCKVECNRIRDYTELVEFTPTDIQEFYLNKHLLTITTSANKKMHIPVAVTEGLMNELRNPTLIAPPIESPICHEVYIVNCDKQDILQSQPPDSDFRLQEAVQLPACTLLKIIQTKQSRFRTTPFVIKTKKDAISIGVINSDV